MVSPFDLIPPDSPAWVFLGIIAYVAWNAGVWAYHNIYREDINEIHELRKEMENFRQQYKKDIRDLKDALIALAKHSEHADEHQYRRELLEDGEGIQRFLDDTEEGDRIADGGDDRWRADDD